MPTERLSMRLIRDVLRLKYETGLSERAVSASLGISKGAIGSYLSRARAAGLSWESGKNLGLRGGSEEWAMQTAIEDGRADLEQAMGAAR